jgi:hypothetical protein
LGGSGADGRAAGLLGRSGKWLSDFDFGANPGIDTRESDDRDVSCVA